MTIIRLSLVVMCSFLTSCVGASRSAPLPYSALNTTHIAEFGLIRFWGDETSPEISSYVDTQFEQVRASGCRRCTKEANFLALSGGGADGAFAAGMLNGWSQHGNRPVFEVVTGVSTGSLAAPFAFLGQRYDTALQEVYTQISDKDIYINKGVFALAGPSLYDNAPLRNLIMKLVTENLLDEISREHLRGRRLLVQTTNIDAQRPVIWDMGAIAASHSKERRTLFVNILLASAAIPVIFPPVSIKVRSGDRVYDELHVDGGVTSQITFGPPGLDLNRAERTAFGAPRIKNLYVIRNGKIEPEYMAVDQSAPDLAKRAVGTMVKYQTLSNIRNLYTRARAAHINLSFVSIPEAFSEVPKSEFDSIYMVRLFDFGLQMGRRGEFWRHVPPESLILSEAQR